MKLPHWLKTFRHRAARRGDQRRATFGPQSLARFSPAIEGLENRAMLTFDAVFELSSLNGANGFQINGEVDGILTGRSVSAGGDINGDGVDDLIIGADYSNFNGTRSGTSYVVFGSPTAFEATLELSALDGSNGFQINGEAVDDRSGRSVSAAGDINGDGIDDLIIGAYRADPNGIQSGASYVVFGSRTAFAATLNLSALTGSNGFQINGEAAFDHSGRSVSAAGDINGDGIDDLIIGANGADPNGNYSGASYVVFGSRAAFVATLNLSALDGSNGVQINGEVAFDGSGVPVSAAGDINGDGIDDLIIGANGADPNGSVSGASYVVFGSRTAFVATLNLSTLDGSNGFQISGEVAEDRSGFSVSAAGDINGDGIDDLIIGAPYADPNGSLSGASYVVFGSRNSFSATLELSVLDGSNGFQVNGEAADDRAGKAVSAAGDINGDGIDDLIIGAEAARPNASIIGASYVVFGQAAAVNSAPVVTDGPDTSSLTETNAGLTDTGSLTVADADLTDLVTAAVDSVSVSGTGSGSVPAALTNTILKGFLTVTPTDILDATETTDTLTWNFNSGSEAFDFLATGATLVLTYTVSATDDNSTPASDTETVTITITGTNDVPTLANANANADRNATEDSAFSFAFAANTFNDVDAGDSLTYSTSTLPSWLSFNPTTRTFSGTPANGDVGSFNVTVTATDGSSATATDTFQITVANTNDAPTLANAIADQNATEDSAFSFAFAANTFNDVDTGDSLTYSTSTLPSWLSFNPATRTFSGTPTNGDVGFVDVTVTATDLSSTTASDTFRITVANTNDPPTLDNAINDQTATDGPQFSFTLAANTFNDVDAGDSLTYSTSTLPSWLSFNPTTRTYSGTPTSANFGRVSITVTATDASGASVSETFDLAVIGTQIVVSDGIVTITDVGGPSNDVVGITIDGDNLVVILEGVATEIPLVDLTKLVFNGGGGNDSLNLDLGGGPLPFRTVFNGGNGGFDTLNVFGFDDSGEFTAYTANYSNRNDGGIEFLNGNTVVSTLTYTGLEPITIDGTPTEIIFNLPNINDTDVRLLDIGEADGIMRLTGSTFETTDFSIAAATSITINANLGNDRVTIQSVDAGYSGQLIVNGGAGNDVLTATASPVAVTLRGDAGNDTLTGSANDDTLSGGSGNDSLNGGTGHDTVAESASQLKLTNTQLTGNGNDKLTSIERAILTGTATSNVLDASQFTLGNVTLDGGNGNDTLLGSAFTGATNDDDLNDSLDGGAGVDVVRQSSRTNQTLSAGPTPDSTIANGAGNDLWTSIEGAYLIGSDNTATTLDATAFSGRVTLQGGAGHDTLIGGSGTNVLNGSSGNDFIIGGDSTDTLIGGAGNDTINGRSSSDLLNGQAGNDTLLGGTGDDRLFGEAGNDRLFGGDGQDSMDGGAGNDILSGDAGHDTITGGANNDIISGGSGNDVLSGGPGNDTLLGDDGADVLRSDGGSDRLIGGRDNDRFEATGATIATGEGDDTITGTNNVINEAFTFDFDRLLVG